MASDDLISTLAHNLGNLLTPLKTRLDLLHRRADREQRERDQRDVEAAVAAANRLTTLMRDLLDSSRLDHGIFAPDAQPIDLPELARQTSAALTTDQGPIRVEAPLNLVVMVDAERIRQAWRVC